MPVNLTYPGRVRRGPTALAARVSLIAIAAHPTTGR
jgi:hypothetical protein